MELRSLRHLAPSHRDRDANTKQNHPLDPGPLIGSSSVVHALLPAISKRYCVQLLQNPSSLLRLARVWPSEQNSLSGSASPPSETLKAPGNSEWPSPPTLSLPLETIPLSCCPSLGNSDPLKAIERLEPVYRMIQYLILSSHRPSDHAAIKHAWTTP